MLKKSQITKIVKMVLPAVVSIIAPPFEFEQLFVTPQGNKKIKVGGGSGFIVDPSGIILTNRHVVANPQVEYMAILNEKKRCPAKVLERDPINDIAILKIDGNNLPVIKLGNSSRLELGQTAIAIGNALGAFHNTVSRGVVSGLSREIIASDTITKKTIKLRGLIQTDAAINPGNSGGPLIDITGRVIGINAAMIFSAENIGFALPINNVKKDLEDLKKYGRVRQPFLGIRYVLLNKDLQKQFNLPVNQGALVISEPVPEGTAVIPTSAAYKAGIKEGDIILEIQSIKVSAQNSIENILQKLQIGETINLKTLRNGRQKIFKAVLEEKK